MYLLSGHAGWVRSVGFSADGSKVVSGSYDKTVKIWNADSGEVIQTLSGEIDKDIYVSQVQYIVYSIVGVWWQDNIDTSNDMNVWNNRSSTNIKYE